MLERLDKIDESLRADNIAEAMKPVMESLKNAERHLANKLDEMQLLQERTLEASDPSYEPPEVVSLGGNISSGPGQTQGDLQVIESTKRKRLRLRLIYALKWIWGTHE